ncbi:MULTISPECIES: hypothetical protein [Butyricimonas]|uniref:hypothetical protein n=1 Tax=Butyricimonas TaxID=574697 RepID=UPI001D073876|nr:MULTISPECIES: hypothetical protein [Butyricimonas]MCB6970895.1 hypothetical protein [Butyricimonas synergistica]MCG4517609.1 hypothetical protein [Butyricimonas sp. DFI.6.44]
MKNKLMYLVAVLFAACVSFSSCSDDDNDDDETLTGTWNYGSKGDIYFELDYKEANIEIPEAVLNMLPEPIKSIIKGMFPDGKVPVATIKPLLASAAKEQLQKYLKGINFLSNKDIEILITVDGKEQTVKTTYETQGSTIAISTDSEFFQGIENFPKDIKSISLNYFFKDGKLTLYLDTTYAKTIIAMIPTILASTGTVTPEMATAITPIVQEISNNITSIKVGPVFVR